MEALTIRGILAQLGVDFSPGVSVLGRHDAQRNTRLGGVHLDLVQLVVQVINAQRVPLGVVHIEREEVIVAGDHYVLGFRVVALRVDSVLLHTGDTTRAKELIVLIHAEGIAILHVARDLRLVDEALEVEDSGDEFGRVLELAFISVEVLSWNDGARRVDGEWSANL